ncbi:5-formyltetrahydrofolate cyclo-ligase [Bacillus wiedmannii]|uniref:5-formyltetrahydrofolate cyclo-ligase n=1 Tax=Bacillus wiedmannii TaxID=1890302 RepID=UPI00094B76CB|nr:5-formyltetrahydrofolate cyclo-ligase [Bacillus wiedmannii]MBZ4225304.1 5-formyltetrahydrofolate cyclo-ligase [Bacillus wiedmannii]MED2933257.1 5-formyltetrahydrofolate cyclo-ligase [Bacillus wiedmannii]
MREEKVRLRKQKIEHMNSLSEERYTTLSEKIAFSLYAQKEWAEAKTIGITLSMENEVNTYPIIEKAWEEGKKVVVPKCNKGTRTMSFRQISNFDQLEIVYMNLREPIPALTEEVNADEIDLQIVPGVAYTERGERIGYGGGYYDRYLMHYKGKTLSLAYSFQIVEHIPVEPFDKNVEKIITEKGTMVKNGLV